MKTIAWLIAIIACTAVVMADSGISVGRAEQIDAMIRVGITNRNGFDLDNARVRAFIPELGIFTQSAAVDLDDDHRTSAALRVLDNVPEGEYLVRISVSKAGSRKVAYRYVVFE